MRIAKFNTEQNKFARYGIVEDDSITPIEGDIFGEWKKNSYSLALNDVMLLAPIDPVNIVALGFNYKEHAKESKDKVPQQPAFFLKSTSALNHPLSNIIIPAMAPDNVDYEAELAIVIAKEAKNISEKEAKDHILGYTCANDVSARDCQFSDPQWTRGKSFDTFAPLGPWVETEIENPDNLKIQSRLNGKIMQDANTSMFVFNIEKIVSYLSHCMTLLPGTVILTGTPAGCGFARKPPVFLKEGDTIEIEIEKIGILKNTVVKES